MTVFNQWITKPIGAGGSGTPGGANTNVQYNNAGAFGGSVSFLWNNAIRLLTINGRIKSLGLLLGISDKIAPYTLTKDDAVITTDSDVTLPDVATFINQVFEIKALASVTILGTIDGVLNKTLTNNQSTRIISNGTSWYTLDGSASASGGSLTFNDSDLVPAVTSGNGSTTGLTITSSPIGATKIEVNGNLVKIGLLKDCYFSDDGGTTAKNPVATDTLYWNGVIAGYELSAADNLALIYED